MDYREHVNIHFILKPKIECEYCSEVFPSEKDKSFHLDKVNGNCPMQPVECIFKAIGCNRSDSNRFENFEHFSNLPNDSGIQRMEISNDEDLTNAKNVFSRQNIGDHMQKCANYHLSLIHYYYNAELNNIKKKLESIGSTSDSTLEIQSKPLSNIDSGNVSDLSHTFNIAASNSNIEDSRYQFETSKVFKKNESKFSNITENSDSSQNKFEAKLDQSYQNLSEKIDMLENNQKALITDLTRVTKNNDKLKHENGALRENIKEYKSICQDLHKALALTQVSLLTLEERLINQEKLSHTGCLLWKITNVHERIQEAKSGRQTSFYSPPFYTDRNGFKMCSRIYLNGDGNGRNTHLSLFFVILRGEFDSLLRWPFRQKVTFTLIDQSETKEHVVDAFRPDPNSSSFKRPISEMNIASGLPVFCPLGKLMSTDHEFIKDNTMFIKIAVDCKDLQEP